MQNTKMKKMKTKVLFVCLAGMQRSPTAARIYNETFGGVAAYTSVYKGVFEKSLWADKLVFMEKYHMLLTLEKHPELYVMKKVYCFEIDDIYTYMDPELISILRLKIDDIEEHCVYCGDDKKTTDALGLASCKVHEHKADVYARENGYT